MNNEYELIITRIKYPKNDTTYYVYDSYDSLIRDLKHMIQNNKIQESDIIRIKENK